MLTLLIAIPALGVLGQATPGSQMVYDTTTVIWQTDIIVTDTSLHDTTTETATIGATTSIFSSIPIVYISPTAAQSGLPPTRTSTSLTKVQVITETRTVTASAPPLATSSQTSTQPGISGRFWSAPPQMTDLGAFNISTFAGGHKNLNIVKGIPAHASATSVTAASTSTNHPLSWDNSSSVLQLLYPAHSINPAKKPQGGAQFYASPLDIAEARNITLQYSVFFPADFDWVLAGKLPGIYGGRTGCSGGDSALDCFSTRLMWRRGGSGELYMYAPKDKQSRALCFHPQSVCDTAYGFSIGRGSFKWARGAWTTVQQSIALNTPGKRDGSFTLDVNGKRVIERHDIYYRGVPRRNSHPVHHKPRPTGLLGLGPLLGGLGLLGRGEEAVLQGDLEILPPVGSPAPLFQIQREWAIEVGGNGIIFAVPVGSISEVSTNSATVTRSPSTTTTTTQTPQPTRQTAEKPVGFIGLFFSTFFGGHDPKYATPRDQYVWFKDFAILHND